MDEAPLSRGTDWILSCRRLAIRVTETIFPLFQLTSRLVVGLYKMDSLHFDTENLIFEVENVSDFWNSASEEYANQIFVVSQIIIKKIKQSFY